MFKPQSNLAVCLGLLFLPKFTINVMFILSLNYIYIEEPQDCLNEVYFQSHNIYQVSFVILRIASKCFDIESC